MLFMIKTKSADKPDIEGVISEMSAIAVTAVPYSPDIMGHHQPQPECTLNLSTSTRDDTADDLTTPYIDMTSPITTQTTTWDKSLLL